MPYLSRQSIETIARRIVTAYKKLPSLHGKQLDAIQPEILARDLLGLTVQYHKLSRDGSILGLTAHGEVDVPVYDDPKQLSYVHLDGRTLVIDHGLVQEDANRGRYHFTLIHEVCHHVFRMLFPKEYASPLQLRQIHYCMNAPQSNSDYWEEWRTNALTSAVLMPEDMVRGNMLAFGLGEKLYMLNRVFAEKDYDRFSDMAGHMGVSKQALAIRMKGLGLLQHDYLENPYSLMDIYPDDQEMERLRGGVPWHGST